MEDIIGNTLNQEVILKKPSKIWYLVPILFAIIGGLVGFLIFKDRDRKFANRLLTVGFIMVLIWVAILIVTFEVFYTSFPFSAPAKFAILGATCLDGNMALDIKNEGNGYVAISKLNFSIDDYQITPIDCSGNINPGAITKCRLPGVSIGSHRLKVAGPANVVSEPVPCR